MSKERERYIRNLAEQVRATYDVSSLEGLKEAVTAHGILLIESPEVLTPSAWYRPELDRTVIFTKTSRFEDLRHWYLGHEFGHVILGHQDPGSESAVIKYPEKEREADMFVWILRGRRMDPIFQRYCQDIGLLLTRPLEVRRWNNPEYHDTQSKRILNAYLTGSLPSQG